MKQTLIPPKKPAAAPSTAAAPTAKPELKKLTPPSGTTAAPLRKLGQPSQSPVAPARKTLVPPKAPQETATPVAPLRRLGSTATADAPVAQENPVEVQAEIVHSDPVETHESPQALAESLETREPLAVERNFRVGSIQGEVDPSSDIFRPRLEFVHNVGPLVEDLGFTPGDLVLGKEHLIWQKDCAPIRIIVVSGVKEFVEQLDYGSEDMPRVFNTVEEVRAAGLWLEWQGNEEPPCKAELLCVVMIEKPDNVDCELFNVEFGDKLYAVAEMRLKASNYKVAGKYLMTIERTTLKEGLHHGTMELTLNREKRGKNTITMARFKYVERNSAELIQFIEETAG